MLFVRPTRGYGEGYWVKPENGSGGTGEFESRRRGAWGKEIVNTHRTSKEMERRGG